MVIAYLSDNFLNFTPPSLHHLSRFLRHVPVIYVDYPGATSLTQIYGTFNRAMLRVVPSLRAYAQPLTDAMVEFYSMSQVNALFDGLFVGRMVAKMLLLLERGV